MNQLELVQRLIVGGCDVDHCCSNGYSPLLQACSSKHLDIVSELCKSGAKAGLQAKAADDVELHYAATNKEWTGKLVQQVGAYGT